MFSFIKKLFKKPEIIDEPGLDVHLNYLDSLKKSAIALTAVDGEIFSRIGGLPDLPDDITWPEWKEVPLAFLGQIDLSEIPAGLVVNELPGSGILYFFYDQEQGTWGFDPRDEGSWQVIYTDKSSSECSRRSAPEGLDEEFIASEKYVKFSAIQTYPDWQDERVEALNLNDTQSDQYFDLCSSCYLGNPEHQLFGYPAPVQGNDMDLECQLASNGIYCGNAEGYNCAQAQELEPGKADWILLMQLDSDDDTGMMWGDMGKLYFWIKKDDLKNASFENCWMILQCG